MINAKRMKTSSMIICNEKEARWTQKFFHCKYKFKTMKMFVITLQDLDLYPVVHHKQMKAINANYNVKMGYWASKNNMQKYKVYAIMTWMFNLNFVSILQQALKDHLWLV
jgi:hypothetical protein